jgi:hypothetical protein
LFVCFAWVSHIQAQASSTYQWQIVGSQNHPMKRYENAYVCVGDRFYLVGGRYTRPVEFFSPADNRWTAVPNSVPPFQMHHFQAVELNGLIYVVGAFTGYYPGETGISHVYIYNPATNAWIKSTEIPAARRRGAAGAVAYNGKIYVVGGIVGGHSWGCTAWFDEFDPAAGTWTVLSDAPRVRDHFQAVVVDDKLYAVGGRDTTGTPDEFFSKTPTEVDVYDFLTGQWSTLDEDLPTGRAAPAVAVLDNKILVMGGESAQYDAHNQTEAYDLTTNTWLTLAPMVQGRHGTQAIVWNNRIFVAAGSRIRGESEINSQEVFGPVYNPPTDFNGDDIVDFNDFSILAQHWLRQDPSVDIAPPYFGDGIIDFQELALMAEHWLAFALHDVTAPGDPVQGVPNDGDWPSNEVPSMAIDDNIMTKYLHRKGRTGGTGFRVTPSKGRTVVVGLTFTTANDAPSRDPVQFELSGSNAGIDGPYTLIAGGQIVDFNQPTEWPRRTINKTPISFANTAAYDHYQLIFTAIRNPLSTQSMQIAEVELLGEPVR